MFYYSGHSDESGLLLGNQELSYAELRDRIQAVGADVNIAILDSCSSGAFTRLKGGTRKAPFLMDESVVTQGHVFLTSSSENEAAQESDTIGSSFFTHYLISALRGAADNSGDGKITIHEAYAFASSETLSRTSNTQAGPQHPSYDFKLTGSGDLVLTDLRATSSQILLSEEIEGRLFIRDQGNFLIAELMKTANVPISLALPPGTYTIILDSGGSSYMEARISLRPGATVAVDRGQFARSSRELTRTRGHDDETASIPPLPSPWPLSDEEDADHETARDAAEEPRGWSFGSEEEWNLVHVATKIALFPLDELFGSRMVIHDLALGLVVDAYRIKGISLGLLSFVEEDSDGVMIGGIFNIAGGEVNGFQAAGIFNYVGGRVDGFQGASIFNVTEGPVTGFQGAGILNITGSSVKGGQAAGIFNIVDGSMDIFQAAGFFNIVAGSADGFQGAGIFNIVNSTMKAFQAAGIFNIAGGGRGLQTAGIFNIISGPFNGVQLAGIFNSSHGLKGFQAATVNVAGNLRGVQLGVVNIGKEINGTQIGVVNINEDITGFPIGIINISTAGFHNPVMWTDEKGFTYAGMQLGTRYVYTLVYGGFDSNDSSADLASGVGVGIHFTAGPIFLEADFSAKHMVAQQDSWEQTALSFFAFDEQTFPSGRLSAGIKLADWFSLFGGIAVDGLIEGITDPTPFHSGAQAFSLPISAISTTITGYARWFIGIRI